MKPWKIITVAVLAVIAVALITASALAYNSRFLSSFGNPQNGMMGGTMPYSYQQATYPNQTTSTLAPLTINQTLAIAQGYLTTLNNPDLTVGEVEEYTQNFYVSYYEKSTGMGAFEMLIDKYSRSIYPETGPNMMWNTKYGMRNGAMRRCQVTPGTPMSVTIDQAATIAQQFLNTYYLGTTVGDVKPFYGYYHVEVLSSGNTYGMLSVNGYSGQVWYHTWHGNFLQQVELYLPPNIVVPPTANQPYITYPTQNSYYPAQGCGGCGCHG